MSHETFGLEQLGDNEGDKILEQAAVGAIVDAQARIAQGEGFGPEGVINLPIIPITNPNSPEVAGIVERNRAIYDAVVTDVEGELARAGISPAPMHDSPIGDTYPDGSYSRDVYTAMNDVALIESTYYGPNDAAFGYAAQLMPYEDARLQMAGEEPQ